MQKIIIIIPCYNEAGRLPVPKIISFLQENPQINICFVNDGSKDETGKIIDKAKSDHPDRIDTVHLEKNSGKGEAIRHGMLHSIKSNGYQWYGYWDADLATPLEEIHHFMDHANGQISLLMGSRVKMLGTTIDRHLHRHYLGRVMATIISNVLGLPVYDTQCGAKLVRQDEVEYLFSEKFVGTWLFDVEMIARLEKKYPDDRAHSHILEVPVNQWHDIPGSKLKARHMFLSLIEITRIWWKYRVKKK